MLIVNATIEGVPGCPISFSKVIEEPKIEGEEEELREERTWKQRVHVTSDGHVFIPPMAIKRAIEAASKYLGEKVKGKGQATYTKNIRAGILLYRPPVLLGADSKPMTLIDVKPERVFVPSKGTPGKGPHVWKTFGLFFDWHTMVEIHLIDPTLAGTPERIERYLSHAGTFIGLARFRPENGGYYGRFRVTKFAAMKDLQAA
jgi:hypothetical protein